MRLRRLARVAARRASPDPCSLPRACRRSAWSHSCPPGRNRRTVPPVGGARAEPRTGLCRANLGARGRRGARRGRRRVLRLRAGRARRTHRDRCAHEHPGQFGARDDAPRAASSSSAKASRSDTTCVSVPRASATTRSSAWLARVADGVVVEPGGCVAAGAWVEAGHAHRRRLDLRRPAGTRVSCGHAGRAGAVRLAAGTCTSAMEWRISGRRSATRRFPCSGADQLPRIEADIAVPRFGDRAGVVGVGQHAERQQRTCGSSPNARR